MATLPSYFSQALSNIEPTADAENAKKAHEDVRSVLAASRVLTDLGIDPILIGSYARSVSIRRVKDVDLFARLNLADGNLLPSAAMDKVQTALLAGYDDDRLTRQDRSFMVSFPDYGLSVDVVAARPCGDHWEIPKKTAQNVRGSWLETNPLKLSDLTKEMNANFKLNDRGVYVPTVKLMRQVKRVAGVEQPGGFFFEILTYWFFQEEQPNATSFAEYLTLALEYAAEGLDGMQPGQLKDPTIDGKTISSRALETDFQAAHALIHQAAVSARTALDEADECRSAVKWQEVLGNTSEGDQVFPLPEYCYPDGSRRATATVVEGAGSPAGSSRYA